MARCISPFSRPQRRGAWLLILILLMVTGAAPAFADPDSWKRAGWDSTDFSKSSVDFKSIIGGGPPKDGIPSIDKPVFLPASKITTLSDTEPVITMVVGADARAYPLQVLMWHEIVNDTVGGMPLVITYCPLCNTAIVFKRRHKGRLLDFGTTGLLRNSDLVMYDRQSQSWWQQFTGEAIVGVMTGAKLEFVPARLESFSLFKASHPDGKVLVPNVPTMRAYGRNPYAGYDSRTMPYGLFTGELPKDINPMARVVMIENNGKPVAVSLSTLRKRGTMIIGDITLSWKAGQNSALDSSVIAEGRDVGNVVARRKTAKGFEDVVNHLTFAFAFYAFYPDAKIMQD